MREKGVTRRLASVEEVRASLESHRARVGPLLDARHPPPPDGGTGFSYQVHFDHLDNDLATVQDALVSAEDEHVRKQIRVTRLRRQTDEIGDGLYGQQVTVRRALGGLYGDEVVFDLAAASGTTPRSRKELEEQVDQTVKLLRSPENPPPPLIVDGVVVDFERMAARLEAGLQEFRAVRLELAQEVKAADGTRILKNEAIAEFDRVFPWIAQSLEGFFRLVGETELADRIRTSRRRVNRPQPEESDESPPEESSDASEAAVAPSSGPPEAASSPSES